MRMQMTFTTGAKCAAYWMPIAMSK